MVATTKVFPWRCPAYPDAKIRHCWDKTMFILTGIPKGRAIFENDHCYCNICGRELALDSNPKKDYGRADTRDGIRCT